MSNSVPARQYLPRNVEQVLIIENQFRPFGENFWKTR